LNLKPLQLAMIYLVIIVFGYMVMLTVQTPYPNGRDSMFHILVARAWHKGMNGMISPVVMDINKLPYPPMYHILLAPFTYSQESAIIAQKALQCLFYPIGLLLNMLLARKYKGDKIAILYGLLLTGTYYAFGMMQARPQSLEVLLFPVAVWALLEKKKLFFFISVASMFYLHSPLSLALSAGLFIYGIARDKKDLGIWLTLLFVAPMVLYQGSFMLNQSFLDRWVTSGDLGIYTETMDFIADPAYWLINGLGMSVVGFFAIPVRLIWWRNQSELDKLMVYSFLGFLIATPIWYMRVFHFAIMPLAFFTAVFINNSIKNSKSKYLTVLLVGLLLVQVVWFMINPVFWMSPPPYMEQYW